MSQETVFRLAGLFADRADAGRALAAELESERAQNLLVVGLARGGVEVAAEVACALDAQLDVVAVRKVRHPWQPEYGIGAVTPGGGTYLRGRDGLTPQQVERAVGYARVEAERLDARLHADHPAVDPAGRPVIVVDDGLATGATMIAALRWARASGAARVVAAVPVGASESLEDIPAEADDVVCPNPCSPFFAVGVWYRSFGQVDDEKVIRLLAETR